MLRREDQNGLVMQSGRRCPPCPAWCRRLERVCRREDRVLQARGERLLLVEAAPTETTRPARVTRSERHRDLELENLARRDRGLFGILVRI